MSRTIGLVLDTEDKSSEQKDSPFKGMDVEQLMSYAEEKGIDIGNASTVNGIIKKITEAEDAKE